MRHSRIQLLVLLPVALMAAVNGTTTASDTKFDVARPMTLSQRIDFWSGELIISRTILDEIANGVPAPENHDSEKWIEPRFNCTLFVETVLSLARSNQANRFYTELAKIRYQGPPTFLNRNHFTEADWIPKNAEAGILRDITQALALKTQVALSKVHKRIDRPGWLKHHPQKHRAIAAAVSDSSGRWETAPEILLNYISIGELRKMARLIPTGTVANLVRGDHPAHPTVVTHQGFIIQKSDGAYFRHSTRQGILKTVRLIPYLVSIDHDRFTDWPVLGLNLLEPLAVQQTQP